MKGGGGAGCIHNRPGGKANSSESHIYRFIGSIQEDVYTFLISNLNAARIIIELRKGKVLFIIKPTNFFCNCPLPAMNNIITETLKTGKNPFEHCPNYK